MIQNDQVNAVEETALEVDAADGVLANDTSPNGPLTVVEGWYRTTEGGQIYFLPDGSYDYISAAGFSGTDTVQYTALDASNNVAGTATLTIDVAATALLPFVSIGTQLGARTVVAAGFAEVGNGVDTNADTPVALTGGGYVITVNYLDQEQGSTDRVQTYNANGNLLGTFDPGPFVFNLSTAALTDGDYILAWDTGVNSETPPLTGHVELFSATGKTLGGPFTLDLPAGADGISKIAAQPGGGFVVLQEDQNSQLYAWSFNAAGVAAGQPVAIGPSGVTPYLAVLPDGDIVFAQIVNGNELQVQLYDAHGSAIGSEILPPSDGNTIDPDSIGVKVMDDGGFALSWESIVTPFSHGHGPVELTHVQLVTANGDLVGNQAEAEFAYTTLFGAPDPTVTPLANGGFVVNWRGIIDNGQEYEGVQAYDANGNAVGSLIEFQDISASGTSRALVFALPAGGFAVGVQGPDPANGNLLIYDNNGNFVGDVPMEYAGDGANYSSIFVTDLADGNALVLYDEENETTLSSRATVQTLNLNNGSSTPNVQTGISFFENTVGKLPVVVSIPDPDGSEIVQSIDIAGIPAGWTLSDPGATTVLNGSAWTVSGGNTTHGGEIDLSLTPPTNFVGSATLTVTADVVDTVNGSVNQSIPVTFNVTVAPATWAKIDNGAPAAITGGDFSGSGSAQLVASYNGAGTFVWDAAAAGWSKIDDGTATILAAGDLYGSYNGNDNNADLAAYYAGAGTYIWQSGVGFTKIDSGAMTAMTTGAFNGGGVSDIAASFAGAGVYLWASGAGWTKIDGGAPTILAAGDFYGATDGNANKTDLVAYYQGVGTYIWGADTGWAKIDSGTPAQFAAGNFLGTADGNNNQTDLAGYFPGYGTYVWSESAGWQHIDSGMAAGLAAVDLNGNGQNELLAYFTGAGAYEWQNGVGWRTYDNTSVLPTSAQQALFATGNFQGGSVVDAAVMFPGQGGIWLDPPGMSGSLDGQNAAFDSTANGAGQVSGTGAANLSLFGQAIASSFPPSSVASSSPLSAAVEAGQNLTTTWLTQPHGNT